MKLITSRHIQYYYDCAGSQYPDWEPRGRSSGFARLKAGASNKKMEDFIIFNLIIKNLTPKFPVDW